MDNIAVKILLLMSLVNVFILTANVLTLAMPTTETGSATGNNDTEIICITHCSVKHNLCAKWCPKTETNIPNIELGNETSRSFAMINAPDMCAEGELMSRGRCRKIVY